MIKIGSKELNVHSSAYTAVFYQLTFGRDLFKDLKPLIQGEDYPDMNVIHDLAYCLVKEAGEDVPENVDDWVKEFGALDFFNARDQILSAWMDSTQTTVASKKKAGPQKEK